MVRPAERTNTTDPVAERRFDMRVIVGFLAGALLLLLIFVFVGSRLLSYGETRTDRQQNSQQTQEDDKRAAP